MIQNDLKSDQQLSVQLETAETYAVDAATEFVKLCGNGAGMRGHMSQIVAKRALPGALRHHDGGGVIPRMRGVLFGQAGH